MLTKEARPAKQIKMYLHQNGIKQNFLANKLGRTDSELSNILNEKCGLSAKEFIEIVRILNIDVNDILNIKVED